MDLKYSNACKEVLVLFDYFLDENDLSKIPKKQIEHLKKNANHQYTYIVDETKVLEEQEISKEAKAIIVSLYKKYFANNEQKMKVDKIVYFLDKQKNISRTSNSGFNNLEEVMEYKNRLKENEKLENRINETAEKEENALVKSESGWRKFINQVLTFFRLK